MTKRLRKRTRHGEQAPKMRWWQRLRDVFGLEAAIDGLNVAKLETSVLYSAAPIGEVPQDQEAAAAAEGDSSFAETLHGLAAWAHGQQADLFSVADLPDAFDGSHLQADEFITSWQAVELAAELEVQPPKELVFVDASADGFETLVADLMQRKEAGDVVTIVMLDSETDGVQQITRTLQQQHDVDAVHVFSSGRSDGLQLGSTWLDIQSLWNHESTVARWAESLSGESKIRFYGCDLAASGQGQTLLESLGELCDCDVAAHDASSVEPVTDRAASSAVELHRDAQLNDADALSGDESREIVFIDLAVEDYETLVNDLAGQGSSVPGTGESPGGSLRHDRFDIVFIDSSENGIAKITNTLAARGEYDAVHVVSHGNDRGVKIGDTWLSGSTLPFFQDDVASWGKSLTESGDLLFYGCDLAESAEGRAFLQSISELCDGDVAASDDATGATSKGGDWDLEYHTGTIETPSAVSHFGRDAWQHLLAVPTYVGNSALSAGEGTISPALPAGIQTGDVLVAFF